MAITLYYFGIRGRGEPIRLILEDAGVAYEENNDAPAFFATKQDLDLWPFNQMPVLQLEDGTRLAQQEAICRYLAATHGYTTGASDALLQYRIDALGAAVEDLCNPYVQAIYDKTEPLGCKLKPFVEGRATTTIKQFEHLLSKESGKTYWFDNDKPSYPEFTLFHMLTNVLVLAPGILADAPLLAKWFKAMGERKGIKAYLDSGKQKAQINAVSVGLQPVV